VNPKSLKSSKRLRHSRFLLRNPTLKALSLDFNQNIRFAYVCKGLKKLRTRNASQRPGLTLLDVGAGLGTLSNHLFQEFGFSVINIEISPKGSLRDLVVADGRALPFRNNTFDFVISSDVLEHVKQSDRGSFISELLRCSTQGIVITYSKIHRDNQSSSGVKIFEKLCINPPEWYLEHNYVEIVDDTLLMDEVKKSGAKIAEIKPLSGVFSLFFTSAQCRFNIRGVSLFLNAIFYLVTRIIDPPPHYGFGMIAANPKTDEVRKS
jgi:2-polyprenyl-3-methyl-5-hydroxy-6-metoxy-1,4-benzoquinol methylase